MDFMHLGLRGLARSLGAGEGVFQGLHAAGGAAGNHALAAGVFAIVPVRAHPGVAGAVCRVPSVLVAHSRVMCMGRWPGRWR